MIKVNNLKKVIKIYKNIWKDIHNTFNEDFLSNINEDSDFIETWCNIEELKESDSEIYGKNITNDSIFLITLRYIDSLDIDDIIQYKDNYFLIKKIEHNFEKKYTTLSSSLI